jgi:hypothetical protein
MREALFFATPTADALSIFLLDGKRRTLHFYMFVGFPFLDRDGCNGVLFCIATLATLTAVFVVGSTWQSLPSCKLSCVICRVTMFLSASLS